MFMENLRSRWPDYQRTTEDSGDSYFVGSNMSEAEQKAGQEYLKGKEQVVNPLATIQLKQEERRKRELERRGTSRGRKAARYRADRRQERHPTVEQLEQAKFAEQRNIEAKEKLDFQAEFRALVKSVLRGVYRDPEIVKDLIGSLQARYQSVKEEIVFVCPDTKKYKTWQLTLKSETN